MAESLFNYWIKNTIEQNKDKNFVDRIINADKYPVLEMGGGNYGTHRMSYASLGDKYIAYPEIIYDQGEMKKLGRREALDYAVKNKQYIQFDNSTDAELFGQNYKSYWGSVDNYPTPEKNNRGK